MGYRIIVAGVVGLHFAFLGFVLVGGFTAQRWPRLIWLHIAAVAWAIAILAVPGLVCPLTAVEDWARHGAGMRTLTGGFIHHYVEGSLYPAHFIAAAQVAVALCITSSWFIHCHRRRLDGEWSAKPTKI